MNQIIEQMLKQYDTQSVFDKKNSIKEIIQEIVLSGLSRAGFLKSLLFMAELHYEFSMDLTDSRRISIFH